jgi:rhodanese-related sulfurtransferase
MSGRVDAKRARDLIASGVTVVDVLPASVFEQEHLPGAMNVPLESFDPEQLANLDRTAPVVIYCFDQH